MESSVINRDLTRWTRRGWFWCVFVLFAAQLALLFSAARPLQVRSTYPREPVLQFPVRTASQASGEWLELEDPMLFASPNWKGVSGSAWMRKPAVDLSVAREFPPIDYLSYGEAAARDSGPVLDTSSLITVHRRAPAQPLLPVLPPPGPTRRSRLAVDGFDSRQPLSAPELPVQLHSDAVGRTIVQAAIDPDGLVLSARVITSSGSKQADLSALNISRTLRFEPLRLFSERGAEISWGKLIFQWHALGLESTNAVRR